ncbi:hypothetical protein ACS0TY_031226 [Phlomoides rotata]
MGGTECSTEKGYLKILQWVLRVLKYADVILSEDTRHSGKLLKSYNIKTKDILVVPVPGPSALVATLSAFGTCEKVYYRDRGVLCSSSQAMSVFRRDVFYLWRVKELIEKQKSIRAQSKYPHRLSRKGYANYAVENVTVLCGDEEIDRAVFWVEGRKNKEGEHGGDELQEAISKIERIEKLESTVYKTRASNSTVEKADESPIEKGSYSVHFDGVVQDDEEDLKAAGDEEDLKAVGDEEDLKAVDEEDLKATDEEDLKAAGKTCYSEDHQRHCCIWNNYKDLYT